MALTSDGKANDTKPMIADAVTRMWSSPVLGYFILRPWAYFGAYCRYVVQVQGRYRPRFLESVIYRFFCI
jgi:hypothetical protein